MDTEVAIPLSVAIGQNLRAWREEVELSQAEVAESMKTVGAYGWDRSTVALIESGKRRLSLEELLALSVTFGEPISTWLSFNRQLEFQDKVEIDGAAITSLAKGQTPANHHTLRSSGSGSWHIEPDAEKLFGNGYDQDDILDSPFFEAEQSAASRFGVNPSSIVLISLSLWGETLSAHRDKLADAQRTEDDSRRSLQAIRGHVTRSLLAQIEEQIKAARVKGAKL